MPKHRYRTRSTRFRHEQPPAVTNAANGSNRTRSGPRLRVVYRRDRCEIRLEDPNFGDLFVACFVFPGQCEGLVELVLDSSRYFVLKIKDGQGKHAFIGLGLTERNKAFDFNGALSDHEKYVRREGDADADADAILLLIIGLSWYIWVSPSECRRCPHFFNCLKAHLKEQLQAEMQTTQFENESFVKVFGGHAGYIRSMGLGITPSQISTHSTRT